MASEAVPEHRDNLQWKCSITSLGALIFIGDGDNHMYLSALNSHLFNSVLR